MRGIWKSYGGVPVLKGVDFDVHAGELHALCGENGAGKSTLMSILAGVCRPDSGEIEFNGTRQKGFESAHAAQRAGISMVFQERSLFGPLSAAENIFAGRQPVTRWGMVDRRRLRTDAARLLATVAPDVHPDDILVDLTTAQQQMVEIAKALSLDARLIIFDEPTAALTASETARLFAVLRNLQECGVGIAYISHRLEEVFALADRVTVLKDGSSQGTMAVSETNPGELIRRMVGRNVESSAAAEPAAHRPVLLEVVNLSDSGPNTAGSAWLNNVSFHIRAGEIVGFAGLAGAGRTELALTLFGARRRGRGDIRIAGRRVRIQSPSDAIAAGIGYLSEDRKESGMFLEMSIRRNISVACLGHFGTWFFREGRETTMALEYERRLGIICRGVEQDVAHLSGGNQQKVLLARWLLVNPRILIVDEPTRGIDVGAKAQVHQLLREFARKGHAVMMISSELPEVLTLGDRICVMRAGRLAGELPRAEATEEAVMQLAAGARRLN
jgi:ABC-type sugar transport system ATPase subunit